MKFCWSTIYVKDMKESLKFYEEIVGLKVANRFCAGPDTEIVFLGEGETMVELICNKKQKSIDIGKDISWGFEVDSVEDKMMFLKDLAIPIEGPFSPNAYTRFFFIKDPNGLTIQFVENHRA